MAKIDKELFRDLLKSPDMGFSLVSAMKEEVWRKTYPEHDNYSISVNFTRGIIDYITGATSNQAILMRGKNPDGTPVKATRKTTSNFSQRENMVVLECVNRLLEKGYQPKDIILEKSWSAGHKTSEYLDIFVMQGTDAYAMIECKTYGKEHLKEKHAMSKLKKDGQPDGQLWAYLQYEKNTKLLCLYSSRKQDDGTIEYINDIIEVKDEWLSLANSRERFDEWKNNSYGLYKNAGIFEKAFGLYNTSCTQVHDLKQLTAETAKQLFQSFLEVLRHNAISDKANAFNKILNIFMCKIIDEDEPQDKRQFWWDENTDMDKFMSILEDLYKRGMESFLNIKITDYSDEDIDKILPQGLDTKAINTIKQAFRKQKTERSSEFAFREIYNEETFRENASIVREVVQLIQPYQFRYGHKHQFLGEFFEELLATSIKQESGQYFTPIRIARFMCTSLPVLEETEKCLADHTKYNLPLTCDYACGSGHFLTEYMDIEQSVIDNIDRSNLSKKQREELGSVDNRDDDYKWASTYVYGIEKDYRLSKTTKLNTFLNGDGDANIVNADGLAPFSSFDKASALYATGQLNGQFTFVIANPPYSVEDFAITMDTESRNIFTLWQDEMSDNIECLFVERTSQLLKEGGYAAIIVPVTISFSDETLFANTRRLLFEKFNLIAVVNLTGKCFAKTDVNTQILFLRRRPDRDANDVSTVVSDFMENGNDFVFNGYTDVIHKYLQDYGEGLSFDKYVDFVKNNTIDISERYLKRMSDVIESNLVNAQEALYKSRAYKNAEVDEQIIMEQECINKTTKKTIYDNEYYKLYYYLLTMNDSIVIADTLENEECKKFTGIKFSTRGGKKGTTTAKINGLINDDDVWNDATKLNYYIHKACIGQMETMDSSLEDHARWANASEIFDYLGEFKNKFRANIKKKIIKPLRKGYIEKRVGELCYEVVVSNKGKYTKEYCSAHEGQYVVYSGATDEKTQLPPIDTYDFDGDYIGFTTAGVYSGTVYAISGKFTVSSNFALMKCKDTKLSLTYVSTAIQNSLNDYLRSGYSSTAYDDIKDLYIHLPVTTSGKISYSKQKHIADDLEGIDNSINGKIYQIDLIDNEIAEEFVNRFGDPVINPKNYKTTRMSKKDLKNGLNCTYAEEGNIVTILTVADFGNNFSINTGSLSQKTIEEDVSPDYYLKNNDIVFVRSNGTKQLVGRCVLIDNTEMINAVFSGFCIRYRNHDSNINNVFLTCLLKTSQIREKLFGRGANISNLNQEMLADLDIITPSILDQESFASYVKGRNTNKEKIEREIILLREKKQDLIDRFF